MNACSGLVDVRRPCLAYFPQGLDSHIFDIHPSHPGYMPMALFAQELVRRTRLFWKEWIKQLQVAWSCLGLYRGKGPADSMLGSRLFHDWMLLLPVGAPNLSFGLRTNQPTYFSYFLLFWKLPGRACNLNIYIYIIIYIYIYNRDIIFSWLYPYFIPILVKISPKN